MEYVVKYFVLNDKFPAGQIYTDITNVPFEEIRKALGIIRQVSSEEIVISSMRMG